MTEASATTPTILQVPEWSAWNRFVELTETHTTPLGYHFVHPRLCLDGEDSGPAYPPRIVDAPDIVHLHWPDKLARHYGANQAFDVLCDLAHRGSRVVQTVHNVLPHELSKELHQFVEAVDRLTQGVHFFSRHHEAAARPKRRCLPDRTLWLPHPAYPSFTRFCHSVLSEYENVSGTIGCVGRLRPYKRTVEFARAFVRHTDVHHNLVIAGHPSTRAIDRELAHIATDPRITYRPGFHLDRDFAQLFGEVGWIALPYRELFSSGVLVNALQAGVRLLCPKPVGAGAYGVDSSRALFVDPWDDETAVRTWVRSAAHHQKLNVDHHPLPTWTEAAARLRNFYNSILELPS